MQHTASARTGFLAPAQRVRPVSAARLLAAGGIGLVLVGCGSDGGQGDGGAGDGGQGDGASPAAACSAAPSPAPSVSGPLAAFDLDGLAVPTRVAQDQGYFVVNAVARGEIPELAIAFMEVVSDAGYQVAGSDDEGFEAEVFFASGQVAAGQVILTESDCAGVVDVKITLLDDEAVIPDSERPGSPLGTATSS